MTGPVPGPAGDPPSDQVSLPRPGVLIVIVGTGTEVGKTWVGARLIEQWRAAGLTVAARKPAQSFEPGDDTAGRTDAQILAAATDEAATVVCPAPRWYPVPMAPPIAAAVLGHDPFTIAELAGEIRWKPGTDVGIVETAGGIRSPQADDGDVLTLLDRLAPDRILLVADAGLGTINAVTLSLDALGPASGETVLFLNRYDPSDRLHTRNRAWLHDRLGLDPVTAAADLAAGLIAPRAG